MYFPHFFKYIFLKSLKSEKNILKQLQSALICLSIRLYLFTDAFFA